MTEETMLTAITIAFLFVPLVCLVIAADRQP